MSKKIIISILLVIILIQSIIPIKTIATEADFDPSDYSNYNIQSVEDVNRMTGLDLRAGILIEPTVDFFTVLLDALMSILTRLMLPPEENEPEFEAVMSDEKNNEPANIEFPIDSEQLKNYESASRNLNHIKFPNFKYSPEEIFSGEIDIFDINFISGSNDNEGWKDIRTAVKSWYRTLRMAAVVGLLSVLIYIGIKIILSSNTKDKAKYKEMIMSWFIGMILAFSMHYIMTFILSVTGSIVSGLNNTNVVKVTYTDPISGAPVEFSTNLIGLARFQMQQQHFTLKVGHLVMYTALVVYTIKFTFVYFKRVLKVAFLTMVSPIVALTYPLDKVNDGSAQGFNMWIKEFIFNALLQPMHQMLYYILVSSSLALATKNPIYGIVTLMFMTHAEKLLKSIFGFGKAGAGTVGGLGAAFTTGAITGALTNFIKDPTHPFGSGNQGGASGGSSSDSGSGNDDYSEENGDYFNEDTRDYNNLLNMFGIASAGAISEEEEQDLLDQNDDENDKDSNSYETDGKSEDTQESNEEEEEKLKAFYNNYLVPYMQSFFRRYRQNMPQSINGIKGLSYYLDGSGSFEDFLNMISEYKRTGKNPGTIEELKDLTDDELKNILRASVASNESNFNTWDFAPQYMDEESDRSSSDILEELLDINDKLADPNLSFTERQRYQKRAQKLLRILKTRMSQNQYINRMGGPVALLEQENAKMSTIFNSSYSLDDLEKMFYSQLTTDEILAELRKQDKRTISGVNKAHVQNPEQLETLESEGNTKTELEKETKTKQVLDNAVAAGVITAEQREKILKEQITVESTEQVLREAVSIGIINETQREEILKEQLFTTKSAEQVLRNAVSLGIIKESQIGDAIISKPAEQVLRDVVNSGTINVSQLEKLVKETNNATAEPLKDLKNSTKETRNTTVQKVTENGEVITGESEDSEPIIEGLPNRKQSLFAFSKIFRRRRNRNTGLYESLEGVTDKRTIQEIKARNSQRQWKEYLNKPKDTVKVTNSGEVVSRNVNTSRQTQILSRKKTQSSDPKVQPARYSQGKIIKKGGNQTGEDSSNNYTQSPMIRGIVKVGDEIRNSSIDPIWDSEKDGIYNGTRLAGKLLKGVVGTSVGIAAAAVQMGISITDGKYNPLEGAGTIAAGIAGVSHLGNNAEQGIEAKLNENQSLERYSRQWYNRDDIISKFNKEYPGEGKDMRRRAADNYIKRGITDFKDQKEGIKYADTLIKERGLTVEEADKIAIATLQYKKDLIRTGSYTVLFNQKKREKYINTRLETYSGSASQESVKSLHRELINNVREFDRVNN